MGALLTLRVLLLLSAFVTCIMSAFSRVPVWVPLFLLIVVVMLGVFPK